MSSKEAPLDLWEVYQSSEDLKVKSAAFEEIVEHYQYLVVAVSRRIKSRLPDFIEDEELISKGQLGLLKAISKYEIDRGPFSQYASAVIWGAVHDGLRSDDFAPRGLRKQQRELESARKDLQLLGVSPNSSNLAEYMGLSEQEVDKIEQRLVRAEVTPTDPTLLPTYRHSSTAGDGLWSREMCREFVRWLQKWDDLTQEIVLLRYWGGMSLKDIGDRLQENPNVIRDRHRKVLTKLLPFMRDLAT